MVKDQILFSRGVYREQRSTKFSVSYYWWFNCLEAFASWEDCFAIYMAHSAIKNRKSSSDLCFLKRGYMEKCFPFSVQLAFPVVVLPTPAKKD